MLQEFAATDTVVPLQPIGSMDLDLQAFPQTNPPLRTSVSWTVGIDTAVVELRPPFDVLIRFKAWEGPLEARVAVIQKHLARAQKFGTERDWGS